MAPKKSKSKLSSGKSKKAAPLAHPTYATMAKSAILKLKERDGSSVVAISKQIAAEHGIEPNKNALSAALKKGVADESLVKVKASYKLKAAEKAKAARAEAKSKENTAEEPAEPTVKRTKPKVSVKKAITKKTSAKNASPKKVSAKESAPKKITTKKAAPKKATAKKAGSKKASSAGKPTKKITKRAKK